MNINDIKIIIKININDIKMTINDLKMTLN